MGLDMYLEARVYVSGYEHSGAESMAKYNAIIKQIGLKSSVCKDSPSLTVCATIAYWRKANAIHKWFVKNIQKGVDECQDSYVDRDQLKELLGICKQVKESFLLVPARVQNGAWITATGTERIMEDGLAIEDPSVAMELLPTEDGFFFGSATYDQWYARDIDSTIEQLEGILKDPNMQDVDFYYRASW